MFLQVISVLADVRSDTSTDSTNVSAILSEGVLTGKGLTYGGSLIRTQATGYGVVYILNELMQAHDDSLNGKTVIVTGSGNVAIYAVEKATQLGAKVVAMCDSNGFIHDPDGIKLDIIKDIKEVRRARIKEYADQVEGATYTEGLGIWNIKCDVYLPCATQNELGLEGVKALISNGCKYIVEGANMPTTLEATEYAMENGVLFPSRQSSQCRWCCYFCTGNEPELSEIFLDSRRS